MKKSEPISLQKLKELLRVQELPGTPEQLEWLRESTQELVDRNGEWWVILSRERLLLEWEELVKEI